MSDQDLLTPNEILAYMPTLRTSFSAPRPLDNEFYEEDDRATFLRLQQRLDSYCLPGNRDDRDVVLLSKLLCGAGDSIRIPALRKGLL